MRGPLPPLAARSMTCFLIKHDKHTVIKNTNTRVHIKPFSVTVNCGPRRKLKLFKVV